MQSFLEQLFTDNVIIQKLHHFAVTVGFNRKLNLFNYACLYVIKRSISYIKESFDVYFFRYKKWSVFAL